ncbi:MAG: glycosyltransferase [Candidatus Pacearchaeota archaeon]|nr:glycosyltransferase [Candidatus Pacearchaeota archaeon]
MQYFKFNRDENSGRSSARDRGIDKAKGDILIFIDNDQIVGENFIEQHYNLYKNIPPGIEILQIGSRKYLFPDNSEDQNIAKYNTLEELNNTNELLKIGKRRKIENLKEIWRI